MVKFDAKNCLILEILQEEGRMSLTKISKKVGLSIDSVKKRIDKMTKQGVFSQKIHLRPKNFGFNNIIDIKIKLQNYTPQDITKFTDYLVKNPYVTELFSVSGEWDFSMVVIARDTQHFGEISRDIKNRFNKIINGWLESTTIHAHKFEEFDMFKLMEYRK